VPAPRLPLSDAIRTSFLRPLGFVVKRESDDQTCWAKMIMDLIPIAQGRGNPDGDASRNCDPILQEPVARRTGGGGGVIRRIRRPTDKRSKGHQPWWGYHFIHT
jgi:hypothetical protein